MRLKSCPHCQVRLQSGEAMLGWCGACGNCLFQRPYHPHATTPATIGRDVPLAPEWRWVWRGVVLKLLGLCLGAITCLCLAVHVDWQMDRLFASPLPAGFLVALLSAVFLDVLGRILCLATPQAGARWLIITSVIAQFAAGPFTLGALVAADRAATLALIAAALIAQIFAAVAFTVYLYAVGVYLRSAPLILCAAVIKWLFASAGMIVAVGIVITAFLFALALILVLLLGCCCLGLLQAFAERNLVIMVNVVAYLLVPIFTLVELAYGAALVAVCRELWLRNAQTASVSSTSGDQGEGPPKK